MCYFYSSYFSFTGLSVFLFLTGLRFSEFLLTIFTKLDLERDISKYLGKSSLAEQEVLIAGFSTPKARHSPTDVVQPTEKRMQENTEKKNFFF